MGLNPSDGEDFVAVYIDDVLVFSCTLEEHLEHLRRVIDLLEEVEYLGHLITPQGLKPNPKLVEAIREFPAPQNLKQLCQFLGLSSYYRRFIPKFAKVVQPLNRLIKKDAAFEWDAACHETEEEAH